MNGAIIALGVAAAISIVVIGLTIFRNGSLTSSHQLDQSCYFNPNGSSLQEDFDDILEFIPLDDIERIIHSYAAYDKQIKDTIIFIKDMEHYIIKEFKKLPNLGLFLDILHRNGFNLQQCQNQISEFWKNIPPYENKINDGSYGGFAGMVNAILHKIQAEELHALLCYKVIQSRSFRHLLLLLMSQEFIDLCAAIEESRELQRLSYWAKEAGIEIIFAVELFHHLHFYLTSNLNLESTLAN